MASSKWKTFEELNNVLIERDYVFWGASNWIDRTIESLRKSPKYIVDNSKLNQGSKYLGYQIEPPSNINIDSKPFVIITTVNYISVIDELNEYDYVMGEDYCCTPLLNKRKDKDNLINHKQTILISSSQHFADEKSGGGLYRVDLNPFKIKKVYSGKGRGITFFDNKYYLIDMLKGIVILDLNFNEIGVIDLQKNCEPHGICVDKSKKLLCVGQPGRDSVALYEINSKKLVDEIFISDKWSKNRKDNHHINDPFIYENSLFLSMFSFSGNWLNEIYDGGIMEIDLQTKEILGPVVSNKWMPHSVLRINGKLTFLNSMLGELWCGSYEMVAKTNGFARGLAYDGKYFYIGLTEHRYPEKLKGLSSNISMDTGFVVFDSSTKMSKFYEMKMIESIHSIIVLEDGK